MPNHGQSHLPIFSPAVWQIKSELGTRHVTNSSAPNDEFPRSSFYCQEIPTTWRDDHLA